MKNRKPILFNTEMVQAILDGRKTQTRRVVKSRHESGEYLICRNTISKEIVEIQSLDWDGNNCNKNVTCPYGKVGDVLWVRETIVDDQETGWIYKNGTPCKCLNDISFQNGRNYIPSIHVPFEACRLFLQITNIRIERLQDIGDADAANEGCIYGRGASVDPAVGNNIFINLWQSIYGEESWNANPWVWVIEFNQITKEEALS